MVFEAIKTLWRASTGETIAYGAAAQISAALLAVLIIAPMTPTEPEDITEDGQDDDTGRDSRG